MPGRYTVNEDAFDLSITVFMLCFSHPAHESEHSEDALQTLAEFEMGSKCTGVIAK